MCVDLYHDVLERPEAMESLLMSVQCTGDGFTGLVRKGVALFLSFFECVTNLGKNISNSVF